MEVLNIITTLEKRLKVLFLLPFFTFGLFLVFACVTLPFYLYRKLVTFLVKFADSDVTRVISGLSATLVRDYDSHQVKPLSTIVVCVRAHGSLNIARFRQLFQERIISKQSQFAELQQFYKSFMGYVFLKRDKHFDLNNHVKLLETRNSKISEKDVAEIWEDLLVKPFPKNRSPWECLLVEDVGYSCNERELNESEQRNLLVFIRVHHGIADGFSVQNMLTSLDGSYNIKITEPLSLSRRQYGISNLCQNFFQNCHTAMFGPAELLNNLINHSEDYHTLHLPTFKHSKEFFVVESEAISVSDVKKIRKHYGVAFTTILLSIMCGGIRKFLVRNKRPFPSFQALGIPFAQEQDQQEPERKLRNAFLLASMELPIHETQVLQRMHNIQGQLTALRRSSLPHFLDWVVNSFACFPIPLLKFLTKKSIVSTSYSTLPGPKRTISFPGLTMDEVNFAYGTGAASQGLCFSSITYLDKLRVTIFLDKNLVRGRKDKAEEIIQYVMEEFNELRRESV